MIKTETESGFFGANNSTNKSIGMRINVLPVELHDLPLASRRGVFGFYAVPPRGRLYSSGKPPGERSEFHLAADLFDEVINIGQEGGFGETFAPRPETPSPRTRSVCKWKPV